MRTLVLAVFIMLFATQFAAPDALTDARTHLANDEFMAAEAALREAAKDPNLAPEANYLWYQSLSERGATDRALFRLETAAELARDRADWWLELGTLLAGAQRTEEAMLKFIRALAIDPNYAQAHASLARLLQDVGQIGPAQAQWREAMKAAPERSEYRAQLANLLLASGRDLEALQLVDQGLEANPDSVELLRAQGVVYEKLGENARAALAFEKLAKLSPRDPGAHMCLGRVRQTQGDYMKALAAYRRAGALAPDDPAPPIAMAYLYLEDTRRAAVALQNARRGLRLAPDNIRALAAEGWALYNTRHQEEGIEKLTAAANTPTGCPDALYFLGLAAEAEGDRAAAEGWFRKAIAEGAGTPVAARAAKRLAGSSSPTPAAEATIAPTTQPAPPAG